MLEGCLNLRDLGGYETTDGRRVRTGCLFRSDELHQLTDRDLEAVSRLGIRVVFDLRNADEREARPNRLPLDIEVFERTSPSTSSGPTHTTEEQIVLGLLPTPDDEHFATVYVGLLERLAPELRVRCRQGPHRYCRRSAARSARCSGRGDPRRLRAHIDMRDAEADANDVQGDG